MCLKLALRSKINIQFRADLPSSSVPTSHTPEIIVFSFSTFRSWPKTKAEFDFTVTGKENIACDVMKGMRPMVCGVSFFNVDEDYV